MQTLGDLIDQLVIINLKIWHHQERIYDRSRLLQMEHKEVIDFLDKIADLNLQRSQIVDEINAKARAILEGKGRIESRRHKITHGWTKPSEAEKGNSESPWPESPKVLVTGGTGALGRPLSKALASRFDTEILSRSRDSSESHDIICDLSDLKGLKAAFRHREYDVVIHAAGPGSIETPLQELLQDHISATSNLLSTCKAKRFIYLSSLEVYGAERPIEINESAFPAPRSTYGQVKLASESLVALSVPCPFSQASILRLPKVLTSVLDDSLSKAALENLMTGASFKPDFGNIPVLWEVLCIGDLLRVLIEFITLKELPEGLSIFNVSYGHPCSPSDYCLRLASAADKVAPDWNLSPISVAWTSNDKLKSLCPTLVLDLNASLRNLLQCSRMESGT